MPHLPEIPDVLLPGIRRVYEITRALGPGATERFASQRIPARSIIRSIYFAADAPMREAKNVSLRLAFVDTEVPATTDFVGTNLILPGGTPAGTVVLYTADPIVSAVVHPYNFELPNRQARLITQVANINVIQVDYTIRMIIDGLGQIGR